MHAAEIPNAITAVLVSETELAPGQPFRLEFDWAVPDGSPAGDSFSLTLHPERANANTALLRLTAPDGQVVAVGTWSGRTVIFELTPYVTTHPRDIHGDGWFSARLDGAVVGDGDTTVTTHIAGTSLTFRQTEDSSGGTTPPTTPETKDAWKWAYWSRDDQGTVNPDKAITWILSLPVFDHETRDVTVVDATSADSGWAFSCDEQFISHRPDYPIGTPTGVQALVAPQTTHGGMTATLECTPERIRVVIDRIAPYTYVELAFRADVTDPGRTSFENEYTVTTEQGSAGGDWTALVLEGGGSGMGQMSVPPTAPPVESDIPELPATGAADGSTVWVAISIMVLGATLMLVASSLPRRRKR